MKLESIVPISNIRIDYSDISAAESRQLINKLKNFSVNIKYHRINQVIYFALIDDEENLVSEIYRCTLLQTEILMYKLVQLYNGIVTRKLQQEY